MLTHVLWSRIPVELANEILTQAQATDKKLYRKVLEVLSPAIGLRPVKVLEMPKVERHAQWAALLDRDSLEPLSLSLFTHWLMVKQSAMFLTWLEAIGAAHDGQGMLETFPPCPSTTVLKKGLDALLAAHPPAHVLVYLTSFNQADEAHWEPLDSLLSTDPRLTLTS
jgi:hypothetical protein